MEATPSGLVKDQLNEPVTQHMRTDPAKLNVKLTVGEALATIREKPLQSRIIYFYVVDDDNRVKGVVPTRQLLLSAADKPLGEIMISRVICVPSEATVLEACEFFTLHRLLAFPVVDSERRLLGVVDVELYTQEMSDIEHREGSDQLFQLIGVHLSESQKASPWLSFRNRFPWLTANIAGGIIAALLTGIFEVELQQVVALALFIPVVLALAESVAIQSVSLALSSMRGRHPTLREIFGKLRAETVTGILLGSAGAAAVALAAWLWLGQPVVIWCLLGGITGGVACAAVIGSSVPSLIHYFKREPQVAAGPLALALSDMATLLVYFSLARILLS